MEQQRSLARDTITHEVETQAKVYNKNQKLRDNIEIGDQVLINPHSLEFHIPTGSVP